MNISIYMISAFRINKILRRQSKYWKCLSIKGENGRGGWDWMTTSRVTTCIFIPWVFRIGSKAMPPLTNISTILRENCVIRLKYLDASISIFDTELRREMERRERAWNGQTHRQKGRRALRPYTLRATTHSVLFWFHHRRYSDISHPWFA